MPRYRSLVRLCNHNRQDGQLFCRLHWFALPAELRGRIWRLFRNQPGSKPHREAVREAIRLANQQAKEKNTQ